jgi:hypothetical protein
MGVKLKKPKGSNPLASSSALTTRFGVVAMSVSMPPTRAAKESGMSRWLALRSVLAEIVSTTGMKTATTAVELITLESTAAVIISSTSRRVSLVPPTCASQRPIA